MVIEVECSRCKTAAIKADDPRCSSLLVGVAIEIEDSRCMSLAEGLTLEVDDARYRHVRVNMEDPRCRALHAIW
jgi:hypothetical protein